MHIYGVEHPSCFHFCFTVCSRTFHDTFHDTFHGSFHGSFHGNFHGNFHGYVHGKLHSIRQGCWAGAGGAVSRQPLTTYEYSAFRPSREAAPRDPFGACWAGIAPWTTDFGISVITCGPMYYSPAWYLALAFLTSQHSHKLSGRYSDCIYFI